MKTCLLIALSLLLGVLAPAQEKDAPAIPPLPPGPPMAARAPTLAQWTVTVTDTSPSSGNSPTPSPAPSASPKKAITVTTTTKSGKVMRRQMGEGKSAWDTWCVGELQITIYPDGSTLAQPRPVDVGFPNLFYVDYSQSDFPEFGWVSTANYAGVKNQAGKPCLYFKAHAKLYADDDGGQDLEAYIDLKSRLPVLLIVNTTISKTYAFSVDPSELEIPEVIQGVLKQHAKATAIATRTLPKLAP